MPGSPLCPSSHTSATVHVPGHVSGNKADGNHVETGSTEDAGHPQNLLLGMQTPQGDWGCVPAGCWHNTGEHWGYLLQKPLNLPHREEKSWSLLCGSLLSSGTMHTQAWEGQWQQPQNIRAARGMRVAFWGPWVLRTCLPPVLTFAVTKTCTNLLTSSPVVGLLFFQDRV